MTILAASMSLETVVLVLLTIALLVFIVRR